MSCSWVTSMTVMPWRLSSWKVAMISMLVRRVQVAGGFVGQNDGRLVDQGAGDGHPLLLAAGKLVGMMVDAVGQAHPFQRLPRSVARCS